LCQLVSEYINDEAGDRIARGWAYHHYGTSTRSIRSVFEATMSGCWPNYTGVLVDKLSWTFCIFWFGFVTLVIFAMIRVITALFIKETLANAANNKELQLEDEQKKKVANANKLRALFKMIDESGDGKISWDEMQHLMHNDQAKTAIARLGLNVQELETIFNLLNDGDGHIGYDEFIAGIPKIRGEARSIDVVRLQHEANKVMPALEDLQLQFRQVQSSLGRHTILIGKAVESVRELESRERGQSPLNLSDIPLQPHDSSMPPMSARSNNSPDAHMRPRLRTVSQPMTQASMPYVESRQTG